ncbi:MAG: hypothetical protein JWO36_5395, partial [Myxococcales bacterium]|nr:hypothetical protein [Myxococcales bacterium]
MFVDGSIEAVFLTRAELKGLMSPSMFVDGSIEA